MDGTNWSPKLLRVRRVALSRSLACTLLLSMIAATPGHAALNFVRTEYTAGNGPHAVAVADFDTDGWPDIVVGNSQDGTVSVLLSNQDGTFGAAVGYPTGTETQSIAVGDLNVDGRLDLAAANEHESTVSVLLGDGSGAFGPTTNWGTSESPRGIAVAKLNGDNFPDVVIAGWATSVVSVHLGIGDGTLAPRVDFPVATGPHSVAVGDLNNDDRMDIVTSNSGANSVSVFLGLGDGTFLARTDYPCGGSPRVVAIGDFNEDGVPDLAATNFEGTVATLLGNGDGSFGSTVPYPAGTNPWALAIGDVTGDGHLDLAVTNINTAQVSVLAGHGDGSFETPIAFGALSLPIAIAIEDLDQDGDLDLAVANRGGNTISVFSNTEPIRVTLATEPNPSEMFSPVLLTATVTPSTSIGVVRFFDGTDEIGEAPLVDGAASITVTSLGFGQHALRAQFGTQVSQAVTQQVNPTPPEIVAVKDVPNDQGGRVFVTWRYDVDTPGIQYITGYRIWRRVPDLSVMGGGAVSLAEPATEGGRIGVGTIARMKASATDIEETFWEALVELPAAQLVSYGYTAPTTQDSMHKSNPYTAFFVQALTADPWVFFSSAPDSGYSVDNIPPRKPKALAAEMIETANIVHWTPSDDADIREYRLYRGTVPDFTADEGSLVAITGDTSYVDQPSMCFYKLLAVDLHGNTSEIVSGAPAVATAVGSGPLRFSLRGPRPNPSRGGQMAVDFILPTGEAATLELFDVTGRRVWSEPVGRLGPGRCSVDLGRGVAMASGIYLVRLRQGTSEAMARAIVLP